MNRDLARRVRNVNGITQHKQVLRNDIKMAAKLIHALDEREHLWNPKSRGDGPSIEVSSLAQTPRTHANTVDCYFQNGKNEAFFVTS